MSTDPATITQYYNCLYTEEVEWRPKLDGLEFSMIFAEDVAWLNKPFDEEEVARVVKGFNGDKALGPDGFPMAFFQFVGILFVLTSWWCFMIFMIWLLLRKV